jgi:ABC-type multidrug transport system ATPase subunit
MTLPDVQQKGEKIVLYGPNGAGKSAIINAMIANFSGKSAIINAMIANFSTILDKMEFHIQPDSVIWHIDEAKAEQIGTVRGCGYVFGASTVYFAGELGLFAVRCPEVARRLYLEVYYDKARDPDLGWIPIRHLSYGQRRRLAIEAALETGDFVAVENFEAGLHVDYVADIMKQMAESDAAVMLETHSGLVLRLAMRYGFNMYYVEPALKLKRIERLDDTELFQRELSAFQSAVV